eukprot:GHRQ01024503.1.p1 GENE.GHRQ01024503.1~~GHRQ01024503.1.p1  ORF type:complete len:228 (+),score=64.75 GHRQ01024503.1:770-1453(+)
MMAEVEIQAELGEGCLNLIKMHEIVLTKTHLALVLEYASGARGRYTFRVYCSAVCCCSAAAAVLVSRCGSARYSASALMLDVTAMLAHTQGGSNSRIAAADACCCCRRWQLHLGGWLWRGASAVDHNLWCVWKRLMPAAAPYAALCCLLHRAGGSLTEQVSCLWESALQRGGLFMEEQEASYYLRQVVQAVAFCHKHRVVHRYVLRHITRNGCMVRSRLEFSSLTTA